jgi:hypothetical protein
MLALTTTALVAVLLVAVGVPTMAFDFTPTSTSSANEVTITCQRSTLTVGEPLTCEFAVFRLGSPRGDGVQPGLCQLRIVLCDATTRATEEFIEPTYLGSTGKYRFIVYPKKSGTMTVSGFVYNRKVTKAIVPPIITVSPGAIDERSSVMNCAVSGTNRNCGVRNVDIYGNFVSWCNFTYAAGDQFVGDSTCF